jgi:hypothetical protein
MRNRHAFGLITGLGFGLSLLFSRYLPSFGSLFEGRRHRRHLLS